MLQYHTRKGNTISRPNCTLLVCSPTMCWYYDYRLFLLSCVIYLSCFRDDKCYQTSSICFQTFSNGFPHDDPDDDLLGPEMANFEDTWKKNKDELEKGPIPSVTVSGKLLFRVLFPPGLSFP